MFYKLRDKTSGRYLAESGAEIVLRTTDVKSGRKWNNPSSPITMISFYWYRAMRECVYLYQINITKSKTSRICFTSMMERMGYTGPIELVTFNEKMKEISSKVVDEDDLKLAAFRKAIHNETPLNQLAVSDIFYDRPVLKTWYYVDIEWKHLIDRSVKDLDQEVREGLIALGLNRRVKFHSAFRSSVWTDVTNLRFKRKEDILIWRLSFTGNIESINIVDVSDTAKSVNDIAENIENFSYRVPAKFYN